MAVVVRGKPKGPAKARPSVIRPGGNAGLTLPDGAVVDRDRAVRVVGFYRLEMESQGLDQKQP